MALRGIRGAIVVAEDTPEAILAAAHQLLEAILIANPSLHPEEVASCFFTVTPDLTAEYPAKAARLMGWSEVPLICAQEMDVPHGLKRCLRILIHWNTELNPSEIEHVYLGEAARLRPEWEFPRS
ncbi:MAG: chorismate mutase [Anaerolineales bacterium]|nr:chorismate mutase [Anaerolineales bacterium]MDW8160665.1 chorismate mutase [Anaerolineales bacterium]